MTAVGSGTDAGFEMSTSSSPPAGGRPAGGPPAGGLPAAGRTGPGVVLLGAVQVTLIFTLMAISVPLPRIGAEFGLGRSALVLLSSAYGLSFAGLLLLGGRLTDRHGGRRLLTVGLLLFAAASAAVPLVPGFGGLLALRFAQGAAAALAAPAAMAVLRILLLSEAAYRRAMAGWGGLSVIGATAGNLLSGLVSTYVSWRWMFAAPVVVAVAVLVLAPRLLPADPPLLLEGDPPRLLPADPPRLLAGDPPPRGRIAALDLRGGVLATAGIVLADYGLAQTRVSGWGAPAVLFPLLTGGALLVAFLLLQRRTRDPLLPPAFLCDARRAFGLAAVLLTAAGTALAFFLLALNLQQQRGWSPLRTSGAFVPYAVALLVGGRVARPLLARFGARAVTGGGVGLGAAGLFVLSVAIAGPPAGYASTLLPGLLLLPLGAAPAFAAAAVLAVEGTPPEQAGLAGGVFNTAMELGPTVGLAALLSLPGDSAPLAAAGGGFALAAVAAIFFPLQRI